MTLQYANQPPSELQSKRRTTALIVGVCAAVCAAAAVLATLLLFLHVAPGNSYVIRAAVPGTFASLIGPALLIVFAPMAARGRGGAIAAITVISTLMAAQWLFSTGWFLLAIGPRALGIGWIGRLIFGGAAISMACASLQLWWQERATAPDEPRVIAARSAWYRARVALVISWAIVLLFAMLPSVMGLIFYLEDPGVKTMGGGLGVMFMIFGGIVAGLGVWLLILWVRLRQHGLKVARSTAWQVFAMLLLWTFCLAAGTGSVGAYSVFSMVPTGMLAWILIELMHASLARHEGIVPGGFEVVHAGHTMPVGQFVPVSAAPPPLPQQPPQR